MGVCVCVDCFISFDILDTIVVDDLINNIMFRLLNLFNIDGEPIKLPDNLESLPRADHFPIQRHRWNTNEVQW